jgi:hypothetical protein
VKRDQVGCFTSDNKSNSVPFAIYHDISSSRRARVRVSAALVAPSGPGARDELLKKRGGSGGDNKFPAGTVCDLS